MATARDPHRVVAEDDANSGPDVTMASNHFLVRLHVSKRFVRPAIVRGDLVHTVGRDAFADFKRAVCAWSAAEAECDAQYDAERAEAMELHRQRKQQAKDAPLRRCDECELVLGRNFMRALDACPRWGLARAGVESPCGAFAAKDAE